MDEDDWRLLTAEDWMYGAVFERRRFVPPSPDWDHEHCVLCGEKFMAPPSDALHEGLVHGGNRTNDVLEAEDRTFSVPSGDRIVAAPTEESWVCDDCFSSFEGRFGWTVRAVST